MIRKFIILLLIPFFGGIGISKAEISLSGGYLSQSLGVSSGYNEFIKDRYGASSLSLTGNTLTVMYHPKNRKWEFGVESDDLKGSVKYTTLNSEKQENTLKLQQTIFLLGKTQKRFHWSLGYGTNKLTRNFYGYQDAGIVATNLSNNEGLAESDTTGSVLLAQGLYRLLGEAFHLEIGGRYSISKHKIFHNDKRPGYDSAGLPTSMDFDLGGLGLLGVLTVKF